MPVEMVNLPGHIIRWLEVTSWMDIPGGESRAGIAIVDERTPIFHREACRGNYHKLHGLLLLQEGRNTTGETWIKVVHRGTDSTVQQVQENIDIYEQIAE